MDTWNAAHNARQMFNTTVMEQLVLRTLDKFAGVEICLQQSSDKHLFVGCLFPDVYQLTLAKINAQHLCLLNRNKKNVIEKVLIV